MRTWTKELGWIVATPMAAFLGLCGVMVVVLGLRSNMSLLGKLFFLGMAGSSFWFLVEVLRKLRDMLNDADNLIWKAFTDHSWEWDWSILKSNAVYAWLGIVGCMLGLVLTEFVFGEGIR